MRKVWPQRYVFIFCFILFDIVLALSKEEICFCDSLAYIKEKEQPALFKKKKREKDIFNNSVLGFLQGMTYILD